MTKTTPGEVGSPGRLSQQQCIPDDPRFRIQLRVVMWRLRRDGVAMCTALNLTGAA